MEHTQLRTLIAQPQYRALCKRVIDQRQRMLVELPKGAGTPSTHTGVHLYIAPGRALLRG
jgi:hypothetical protein